MTTGNGTTPPQGTPQIVTPTKMPITGKMWGILFLGVSSLGLGCCYGFAGKTGASIIGLFCILVFFAAPSVWMFKLERERISRSALPQKREWIMWVGLGLLAFSILAMLASSIFVGLLME